MSLPNNSPLDSTSHPVNKPILCYVTDRRSLPLTPRENSIDRLLEKIETAAGSGLDWIQLREKDLSGRDCAALTRAALARAAKNPSHAQPTARILVNDRLDVALAEKAGGVHLGENSLPVREAKRLLLAPQVAQVRVNDFLVGVSCHSLESAKSAASDGADYIFFGPVFATPSKAAFGAPQGLNRLAEVCRSVNIPVLAIGGISLENAASCFSAGASGIASIRLFQDAADPAVIVQTIREQRF